ncbi:MAG: T9SS type A sorting domain-containing protein [Chitinophagaceae bacterium]|nr:T9SS type A sorting domain-containing protein [Chitinophagaceae bacterium]
MKHLYPCLFTLFFFFSHTGRAQNNPQFQFTWSRDIGSPTLLNNTDQPYIKTSDSAIVLFTISGTYDDLQLYFNKIDLNGQVQIYKKTLPFKTTGNYYFQLFPTADGGVILVKYIRLGRSVQFYRLDANGNLVVSKDLSPTQGNYGFALSQHAKNGITFIVFNRYDARFLNVLGSRILAIDPSGTIVITSDLNNVSYINLFPPDDSTILSIESINNYQQYFVRRSLSDGSIIKTAEVPYGRPGSYPSILSNVIFNATTNQFHYLAQDTAQAQPGAFNINALSFDSGFNQIRTTNYTNVAVLSQFGTAPSLVLTADVNGGWYANLRPLFYNNFILAKADTTDQINWAYGSSDKSLADSWRNIIPLPGNEFIAGLYNKVIRVKVIDSSAIFAGSRSDLSVLSSFKKQDESILENSSSRLDIRYNNPSANVFRLRFSTHSTERIHLQLTDVNGRIIEQRVSVPGQTNQVEVGGKLRAGMYFAIVTQGKERKVIKLVKL